MVGRKVVLFADDLTGACDAGVSFRAQGLSARVLLPCTRAERSDWNMANVDVQVHSLESRNLAPEAAAIAQREACSGLKMSNTTVVYKKVDSTLRGNVGPETTALMHELGIRLCIFAPAMPRAGRTTVGGFQLLHGKPVDRTGMGQDPGSPVKNAQLSKLFANQPDLTLQHVSLSEDIETTITTLACSTVDRTVLIVDATEDADLMAVARAVAKVLGTSDRPAMLLAGSAGLSSAISVGS